MKKEDLKKIKEKVKGLKFGSLKLIYHNGELKYIEKVEKEKIQ